MASSLCFSKLIYSTKVYVEGNRDEDSIPALKELSTLSANRYHLYLKHSHRMFSFISQADYLSSPCYIPQMPVRHFHLDVLFKSKIQHGENKRLPQQICSSSYVPSVSFQEPELKKNYLWNHHTKVYWLSGKNMNTFVSDLMLYFYSQWPKRLWTSLICNATTVYFSKLNTLQFCVCVIIITYLYIKN